MATPDDSYDRFFKEKLWELIPSLHRHEDGVADPPGVMRAFVELVAEQAALLRRSHDRLWDDAFIDLCDDWAVPYIGDLVATRMVSAINRRGRRVDVAKTIYYRRRKGTPRVLEELIADITGWDGKVVESFRFLGRCRHRLDPALADLAEPACGWADLRLPRLAERTATAWDPFAHTPDLRRPRGEDGRWNLPAVSFHLFRLDAVPLRGVCPHVRAGGGMFTFDPSGRDVQLFMPRHRGPDQAWDSWTSARPWQVPAPMGCRILGHAEYVIDEPLRQALFTAGLPLAAFLDLAPLVGVRFESEAALREYLETLPTAADFAVPAVWDQLRRDALVEDCGKRALWPESVVVAPTAGNPIPRHRMAACDLGVFGVVDVSHDVFVDPVRGRFELRTIPAVPTGVRVDYTVGFGGPIGAGGYDRRGSVIDGPDLVVPPAPPAGGHFTTADLPVDTTTSRIRGVTELPDSATYAVSAVPSAIESLTVQAANFARPYLVLATDLVFTAAPNLEANLVLDGLWIGSRSDAAVVLAGAWHEVVIRSSTLDPGGTDLDGATLTPVRLFVDGQIDRLVIDHSVIATISTRPGGLIDTIVVRDSILDAQHAGDVAITLAPGTVELRRVTVLGQLDVERLDASDAIVTGNVDVTDTQAGCFRFSAAPEGSRLPHPYRRVVWSGGPVFGSQTFGAHDYTWLAESATDAIRRGAENDGEIGAWNAQLAPIKEDSLRRKVDEYLPFGLIPTFIRET